jgi:hypothetical protein
MVMTKNPNIAFGVCLFLALLIHAVLLTTIKVIWPHQYTTSTNQTLTVLLVTPQKNKEHLPTENISVINKKATSIKAHKANITPVKTKSKLTTESLDANIQSNTNALPLVANQQPVYQENTKPTVNLEQIRESAHEIIRQEAHQLEKNESYEHKDSPQNKLSAVIGSAFKQPEISKQQKIKTYADGMVEVTNADGSKYCLNPTQNFQRGGPVEAQNIPMTCP